MRVSRSIGANSRHSRFGAIVALALVLHGCAGSRPPIEPLPGAAEVGEASYYARHFQGRRTANGERFDQAELTAAHRTLPFGTRVKVTNLANGASVFLRINDRGPFRRGRVIDVSRRAARELGFLREGVTRVRVEVMPDPP
ncbi:MAG: septal ring lytic transglycosylase RlpA family protein [Candidatus Eisenbacteria bacterium]|uniref:Probable endolytic peptidoglycan transglycosylase RlpA n=1 Tax=Eiseniibacteriota bacterium TaxID=2212470 RepID=A0A849SIR4_UNCEI|nr:septal ring lytic transglycosylase RlpA family protein [Candidatus Eisenbacteria bacterium]